MVDGLIINAPLEKLKLVGVSDRSLDIIFKLKSLKSLGLERSDEITNDGDTPFICLYLYFSLNVLKLIFVQGACRSINELPHLEELSVSHCPKIENSLLKAALAIDRSLRVYCKNTNVKIYEFVKEFPNTVKDCADKVIRHVVVVKVANTDTKI